MSTENIRTHDVFGITSKISKYSYVDRGSLDETLLKLLRRPSHIALRGESKCGKSWLRQKTVPDAIVVQCRLDRGVNDIYVDALSQLGVKLVLEETSSGTILGRVTAEGKIGKGLLGKLIGGSLGAGAELGGEHSNGALTKDVGHDVTDLRFIADILRESGKRLVVEDLHYLKIAERRKLAFDLKALWDYGYPVIIIGVWGRSNMLVYLNPDLTGRVEEISMYWSDKDLKRVLQKGGSVLNLRFNDKMCNAIIKNCYGNVGILQALALKYLDELNVETALKHLEELDDIEALESATLHYADQLNPLYQEFAKRVASGIRQRSDSTDIYSHTMKIILEASDEELMRGLSIDYIFDKAHAQETRIHKGNLRKVLSKFESLQIDDQGRGLVVAYNDSTGEVSVVDRQLLLYRKYSTVTWPWEELIAESSSQDK